MTTLGNDCHRDTFPQLLPDGERIDSYRRMMLWFTNHLLVRLRGDGPCAASIQRRTVFEPAAPGAYRAQARIRPRHLRSHLASYANLADTDFVWIYANPIYVVD